MSSLPTNGVLTGGRLLYVAGAVLTYVACISALAYMYSCKQQQWIHTVHM